MAFLEHSHGLVMLTFEIVARTLRRRRKSGGLAHDFSSQSIGGFYKENVALSLKVDAEIGTMGYLFKQNFTLQREHSHQSARFDTFQHQGGAFPTHTMLRLVLLSVQ